MFASEVLSEMPQAGSDVAELTSWDLLNELDFGDGNSTLPQGPADTVAASSSERLKEKNRKAQKRFRERKKERAQTTEAQLAETTSQLHHLRLKQRELEARNSLLEKIATLNKQQTLPDSSRLSANTQDGVPTTRQAADRAFYMNILERSGLRLQQQGAGSAVLLTGCDMEKEVMIDSLAVIPRDELIKLKKAYVHRMAQCLLNISDDSNSKSLIDLQRYSLEITAVFVCCWINNANKMASAVTESLSTQHDCASLEGLPKDQYQDLLVALKYTEAQEQDLMHLRRLFYGKLGQLARDRAALLKKLPAAGNLGENNEPHSFHSGFRNAADQLALTKEVADELCANHAEESLVYMGYGFCLFRCIQTSVQHALLMVNSYPRPADPNTLLEVVAQQHGEPPIDVLMSAQSKDDLQHSANWETVKDYMSSLQPENAHGHCPFLQRQQ